MRVGILGGGQLARMLAQAGTPMGMEFTFLCPDQLACAAEFGAHIIAGYEDISALEKLAAASDVVTYEFENVPTLSVEWLSKRITTYPSSLALETAKDRLNEKQTFEKLGIKTTRFWSVSSLDDLVLAASKIGLPAVLKTRTQGYDGKGQVVLKDTTDLPDVWQAIGQVPAILEEWIPYERELSIIAVRDAHDHIVYYPVCENHHREGMLRLSLSRVGDPLQDTAETLVRRLLEHLDYVGTLALELFQLDGKLIANEIAPRVHNSGHWTIEGARTSQFENHLRAIAGLPLGATTVANPATMVNLIGTLPPLAKLLEVPGAVPHFYGKAELPGRKVGHVTLLNSSNSSDEFDRRLVQLLNLAGEKDLAKRLFQPQSAMAIQS